MVYKRTSVHSDSSHLVASSVLLLTVGATAADVREVKQAPLRSNQCTPYTSVEATRHHMTTHPLRPHPSSSPVSDTFSVWSVSASDDSSSASASLSSTTGTTLITRGFLTVMSAVQRERGESTQSGEIPWNKHPVGFHDTSRTTEQTIA